MNRLFFLGASPAIWSGVVILYAGIQSSSCQAADLQEIVRRATATIQADWAADLNYACVEKDEVQKEQKQTSKTYEVVMLDGSDYDLPRAINDQRLTPDQEKTELEKLKNEAQRRKGESPEARRQRIEKFKKLRDENGELLLDFPSAFTFQLVREESIRGYSAYVLSGTPKKRSGPLSRAAKVLAGMHGTLWIDKENFHVVRAECNVITPVPIYGMLAKVLPGTHIVLTSAPVANSTWLINEFSMELMVSKLGLFKSAQFTRSTYSEYRLNTPVVEELLSKAESNHSAPAQ